MVLYFITFLVGDGKDIFPSTVFGLFSGDSAGVFPGENPAESDGKYSCFPWNNCLGTDTTAAFFGVAIGVVIWHVLGHA